VKRSPFAAVSVCPERLMLMPVLCCSTELTNTFCTEFDSSETDSTKNTRSLLPVSPNTPGSTRETSSRCANCVEYCSPICAAHGEMNSDSTRMTANCGSANSITGLSQAVSGMPAVNQITISESRQLRVSVSSTAMNMVSDSSTGSVPSAKKPMKAITASDGILPPAASPSRRMRRVVSAIANSVMNTAPARPANSLSSARWNITCENFAVSCDTFTMEFSIKTLSPEKAKAGCLVLGVYKEKELSAPARRVDQASKGALRRALGDLPGKAGSTLLARLPGIAAERVLLVGLGERRELAEAAYRDAVRGGAQALKDLGAKDAALFLVDLKVGSRPLSWNVRHAVLGMRDAFYRFDQLKSQKKSPAPVLSHVVLPLTANPQLQQALTEGMATADCSALARSLGNLPPNISTPAHLAHEALKLALHFNLRAVAHP